MQTINGHESPSVRVIIVDCSGGKLSLSQRMSSQSKISSRNFQILISILRNTSPLNSTDLLRVASGEKSVEEPNIGNYKMRWSANSIINMVATKENLLPGKISAKRLA